MNLLVETLESIKRSGHTADDDVDWVGSRDGKYAIGWGNFSIIAEATNYDNGFGEYEIALDLVVMFRDGSWLERDEYGGSEWWAFKVTPTPQANPFFFNTARADDRYFTAESEFSK